MPNSQISPEKFCPGCGAAVDQTKANCPYCGVYLPGIAEKIEREKTAIRHENRIDRIVDGAINVVQRHMDQKEAREEAQRKQEKESRRLGIILLFGAFIFIVICYSWLLR